MAALRVCSRVASKAVTKAVCLAEKKVGDWAASMADSKVHERVGYLEDGRAACLDVNSDFC